MKKLAVKIEFKEVNAVDPQEVAEAYESDENKNPFLKNVRRKNLLIRMESQDHLLLTESAL